jgi:hypothetical protein
MIVLDARVFHGSVMRTDAWDSSVGLRLGSAVQVKAGTQSAIRNVVDGARVVLEQVAGMAAESLSGGELKKVALKALNLEAAPRVSAFAGPADFVRYAKKVDMPLTYMFGA